MSDNDIYVSSHPRQPQGLEEKIDRVLQDVAYMRGGFDELKEVVGKHADKIEEHDREIAKVKMGGRVGLAGLPILGAALLAFWKGELRW